MGGALDGMRVIDLTQVLAGPFCTMLLADLGADVIKVEPSGVGDQSRNWSDSRAFLALNRNKRGVCLDLKSDDGRRHLRRLMDTADVLVENWRPGVAVRLGAGYDELARINPRLVYASVSGFGQTGARDRTGAGQYVETSLFEAALVLSVWGSCEYWATGEVPRPLGSANRMAAPYRALRTRDGYITIGANSERLWQRLCAALDLDTLTGDERFRTNADRMRNTGELAGLLEERLATADTAHWVDILLASGVPAGPIQDDRQVLENDPQVRARGMVVDIDQPVEGRVPALATPLKLSGTPATIRTPAPLLGQHTTEVLR